MDYIVLYCYFILFTSHPFLFSLYLFSFHQYMRIFLSSVNPPRKIYGLDEVTVCVRGE